MPDRLGCYSTQQVKHKQVQDGTGPGVRRDRFGSGGMPHLLRCKLSRKTYQNSVKQDVKCGNNVQFGNKVNS